MTKTQKHLSDALVSLTRAMAAHPGSLDVDEATAKTLTAHKLIAEALRLLGMDARLEPMRRIVKCAECGHPVIAMGRRGKPKQRHPECDRQHRKEQEAARLEAAEVAS